ncbi:MAG: SGNH/GDSL hydrolase family protein [Christensenellaceae bacterium]
MKTILCYGDSNTYGYNPSTSKRYARNLRWTGILQQELGQDYDVVEEGLNGRTTVYDDPISDERNGKRQLMTCLHTHAPLDLVILMLGTNDLKTCFGQTAYDIAAGANYLVELVLSLDEEKWGSVPQVLLISPVLLNKKLPPDFEAMFGTADLSEKCAKLTELYREIAQQHDILFLAAGDYAEVSCEDGLHMTAENHQKLAQAIAKKIKENF